MTWLFSLFLSVAFQCLRLLTWKNDLGEVETVVSLLHLLSACLLSHAVLQMLGS